MRLNMFYNIPNIGKKEGKNFEKTFAFLKKAVLLRCAHEGTLMFYVNLFCKYDEQSVGFY